MDRSLQLIASAAGSPGAPGLAGAQPLVLVLQHAACEPLGLLEPVLATSCRLRVLHAYREPVAYRHAVAEAVKSAEYDAVIALGGPVSVYEREDVEFIDSSLALLRAALRRDVPVLGICLGAQMLAQCLGARVWPGRTKGLRKEIGWFSVGLTPRGRVDPAFHGFPENVLVFQWHGDTFDLPTGSWPLATGRPYRNQAFRFGRWVYGLQFHVEVTADMVAQWVREYADELASLDHVKPDLLVELATRHAPALASPAEVLAERFVALTLQAQER
jgi:GMP synthase (glutamine-hydrolysing)